MSDDFSELGALARDFDQVPKNAHRNIVKAMKYTSVEIKKDWQQGAARSGLHGYAASVDFDVDESAHLVKSEIGPNLDHNQGSFGFVEEGGGGVHSAPQHAGRDALEANESDFYDGMEIALFDATTESIEKG